MEYNFQEIEKYWKIYWKKNNIFKVKETKKTKYYILNMFPYPSGAGLHVGHCLGYIISDIYARYERSKGFNVLNPIGFDSFGLPAEQYAIQTGKHPFETTCKNMIKYKDQINNLGISFDWNRKIYTSDPNYYQWTQWMFIQIYNSWYDKNDEKAKPIDTLINEFQKNGNYYINASTSFEKKFNYKIWNKFSSSKKESILLEYRLAYLSKTIVNWCPSLGTVLANDEIKDGRSQRGGFPVYKKRMMQWHLRISAYAERLLKGLNHVNFPNSLKNLQFNWIGKLTGASVSLEVVFPNNRVRKIKSFIRTPESIFGMTFIILSSEHPFSMKIAPYLQKKKVLEFLKELKNKDIISGVFTGNYVFHPFISKKKIPIFISDSFPLDNQIKSMIGIPCQDKISDEFAKKFKLDFIKVFSCEEKNKIFINSEFLNGLNKKEAENKVVKKLIQSKLGDKITTYKIRDAVFSRQRYWGEPIPIYFKKKIPYVIPIEKLPIILPKISNFHPKNGKSPLFRAKKWAWDEKNMKIVSNNLINHKKNIFPIEINTMPSWAGSSWYYIRYMDPHNKEYFISKKKENYWKNVDLYIGGSEHATGHLIYSRFWHKFLKDRGWVKTEEPFKKILNQGMILNYSAKILKIVNKNIFISYGLRYKKTYQSLLYQEIYIDTFLVKKNNELDINKFKEFYPLFKKAIFHLENEVFLCNRKLEKMSKSKYNVINPDDVYEKYGSDTFRLYEIFLGPITQSKSWDDKKINGIKNFLNKFWRLFHRNGIFHISEKNPSLKEYNILHHTIDSVHNKMKDFSLNTIVSTFMIAVNELTVIKCNKKKILEPIVKLIAPFAPHISEEIWKKLGKKKSIIFSKIPTVNLKYLRKDRTYPIMFNNKLKFTESFDKNISIEEIKDYILNHPKTKSLLKEKALKKLIIIPNKVINILF